MEKHFLIHIRILNKSLGGVDIIVLLYIINFASISFWRFAFILRSSFVIASTLVEVEGSKKKKFLHHFVLDNLASNWRNRRTYCFSNICKIVIECTKKIDDKL